MLGFTIEPGGKERRMASLLAAAPRAAPDSTSGGLPALRASHVRLCALPTWYRAVPALRKRSVRTVVVPAPEAFLKYLRTDGIVLPKVPEGMALDSNDPRFEAVSGWSSSEDEE